MTDNDPNAPYYDANRARWDESVAIHVASESYDLDGFLRGEKTLCPPELAEVGDVRGKSLLHLQCHFGMDTLNWARLGATVTGLDFSQPAIAQARALAQQAGIADATFVHANVYEAQQVLQEQFDIVYTGIGALCWLPDIRRWAAIAAGLVRPGGFLYVYDGHPMRSTLDDERADGQLVVAYPYFETEQPSEWTTEYTYTDGPALKNQKTFEWNHGLGETISAVIDAGLRLDFLHEHREISWKAMPHMLNSGAGRNAWSLPAEQRDRCPLMFSFKATKPG
ncbi:MAG: class I SAM-dependent methyltransferase [Tepidiformaceae bacterium]